MNRDLTLSVIVKTRAKTDSKLYKRANFAYVTDVAAYGEPTPWQHYATILFLEALKNSSKSDKYGDTKAMLNNYY